MDNITINGNIYLSNGVGAASLKAELWDATGQFGLISRSLTSDDGAFSFLFSAETENRILDGTLMPQLQVSYRDTLLYESTIAYQPGNTVDIMIDEAQYNQVFNSSGQAQFQSFLTDITNTRLQKAAIYSNLAAERDALIADQQQLAYAMGHGLDTGALQNSISSRLASINVMHDQYTTLVAMDADQVLQFCEYFPYQDAIISQLDDRVPILFFPVRIETIFQNVSGPELWVRIFPDDIAVETHEQQLTDDEIEAGRHYWRSYISAAGNSNELLQAWDLVCRSFGSERAAWVTLHMTPTNPSLAAVVDPDDLTFPALTPKAYSWGKQPVTKIMPDRFVIIGYANNDFVNPVFSVQTNTIPDELPMGIDPSTTTSDTFVQSGGDITTPNNDVDWMLNFNAAITKGMGKKIPISTQQYHDGFDRIIVLGVKASLDKNTSKDRLENLIDSHHYTDGFSLLKQGTSTSNTDTAYSGYSSVDFGNPTTLATERKAPLFTPTPTNSAKTDGQMLCEALGIDYDNLYHIYQSNGYDIRDAMNINNALFQVAIGYYVGNMLQPLVTNTRVDELRDFFTDYVRARGALPSIRSGIQPYGILPASVYSRINWMNDPYRGLYTDIRWLTTTLDPHWASAVAAMGSTASNEQLVNVLSQPALSTGRVQRVGVGAGYIWNNLVYASPDPGFPQQWVQEQANRTQILQDTSGIQNIAGSRIAQTNFLTEHSSIARPLIADPDTNPNNPLPTVGGSGLNYLQLISQATFSQLRDEDYSAYGIAEDQVPTAQLYQFTRQSLMLEYFDAACKLLNIPDDQRIDPELVNIAQDGGPQEPGGGGGGGTISGLYTGGSRWSIMEQKFQGIPVGDFLSMDAAANMSETFYLTRARNSISELSFNTVADLDMLTTGVMDVACHRLDTWRLALVNQRINALRGIRDGSLSRNTGIFIGGYGWVENIRRRGTRTIVSAPTPNFTGQIEEDSSNQGYIQAPSLSQAAAAAVLRSGYVNNGGSSSTSPFAVNISSERVRGALSILEGIRNGQELAVLLGYEFERRLHDLYPPNTNPSLSVRLLTDQHIAPLRERFYLKNKINTITPDAAAVSETNKARNVVNGISIIETYRSSGIGTVLSGLGASTPETNAIEAEIKWISNLMDATGDLTAAESVFQLVQGNQSRSSAMTDAIARGTNIPEIEHINTPKTGLSVYQRFTLHLENSTTSAAGWASLSASERSLAEPYLNRWVGGLLGNPGNIKCKVKNVTDSGTESEISMADLDMQPLDIVYMVTDELETNDSELSLQIKAYARAHAWAVRTDVLDILYDQHSTGTFTFSDVLPVLKYMKQVITNSRPLKTTDYITPSEADGVANDYDLSEFYGRLTTTRSAINGYISTLNSENTAFTSPAATNFTQVRNALKKFSMFGIEQTTYEYTDNNSDDYTALKSYTTAVLKEANKRLAAFDAVVPANPATPPADVDAFISAGTDAAKALFGKQFNILPLFKVRSTESTVFSSLLTTGFGTLKSDHATNNYLMDEWVSGIAKVRKNAASYEMLTILSSLIDPDAFDGDRNLVPLQTPYATDGTERWLGAAVTNTTALKDGRLSIGISVPGNPASYDIAGLQVGIMIDEWIDVIPSTDETTGIAFHFNQPNAKPPQCLLLGLTPDIKGSWHWSDLVDMINETFDLAKKRAVTYEQLSATPVAQLSPAFMVPFTAQYSTIGFTAIDLQ